MMKMSMLMMMTLTGSPLVEKKTKKTSTALMTTQLAHAQACGFVRKEERLSSHQTPRLAHQHH
jgi:hypothetical protein